MISTTDNGSSNSTTSFKPFAKQLPTEQVYNEDHYEIDIPSPADIQTEETALQLLKQKLDAVPHEMKSSLIYAQQQVGADLVNDEHLLGFLYVEKFNIDVSVCV